MCSTTIPTVQGFKVVGLKFSDESEGVHQLLWKQHTVRTHAECKPPNSTLFVLNVPPYCSEDIFTRLFSKYGKVRSVFFHKKPTSGPPPNHDFFSSVTPLVGFKVAYVVFSHSTAVKAAMSVPADTVLVVSTEKDQVMTGIKKWKEEYNDSFLTRATLSTKVKSLMEAYDHKCQAEKEAAGKQDADDEGWVTVTSAKRKKPKLTKVEEVQNKRKKKKKRKMELVNFYAFQQRQAKMTNLSQLRQKFEEDKKRISQMRASRKFRPY